MTTYRRIEALRRTVRYEFEAPVDAKTIGLALTEVETELERLNYRRPDRDNDYWVEPTDEGIAFVFECETTATQLTEGTP